MFHDCMRARVQQDDGDFPAWFQCLLGPSARMYAVAAIVQHRLCGGHRNSSAAVRGGPRDRLGLDVLR